MGLRDLLEEVARGNEWLIPSGQRCFRIQRAVGGGFAHFPGYIDHGLVGKEPQKFAKSKKPGASKC
eukprot:597478-Amphidinium_carterae.1